MNKFGALQERQLKEFTITEPQNKMETLYYAKHALSQDSYAVKKIQYTSQNLRDQALNVVKKQFQVQYHNLMTPQFYAYDMKNNKYMLYLFMDRGESLEQEIQRRKQSKDYFSSKDLKNIFKPIYQQLEQLERNKFPHRNVKTSNIIQDSQGLWKLSDTGLLSMHQKTREVFDAPELDQQIDHNQSVIELYKCDVYSFGISIIMAATLMEENQLLCFKEQNAQAIVKSDDIMNEIKRNYDKEFYEFIQVCVHIQENMRKSPIDREGQNLYQKWMKSKDYFEGGSSNKVNQLSQEDQKQIDLLLKDIEEQCQKRLKKTCEEFFSSDQFYFKATKTMEPTSFLSALRKIDIIPNEQQINLLKTFLDPYSRNQYYMQSLYDHDKNKTYIGDSAVKTGKKKNLPELSSIQEDQLSKLLKEMSEYAQRKEINIRQEFEKFDIRRKGQLSFDEFKTALFNVGLNAGVQDLNLFKLKFESAEGEMVNYEDFIEEMENFLKVDDQELDGLMMRIYKEIRNRFSNTDDFMTKYQESRKLSYGTFQGFLNQANITANKNLLKKLFNKLDPSDVGYIIRYNLKQGFLVNIDQETHVMIYKIISGLSKSQITFVDLIKKAAGQLKQVSKNQILHEFHKSDIQINEQELQFLINLYEIQMDSDHRIDYRKFRQAIYEDALRQGLKPLFHLQDGDVKTQKSETKGQVQFKSDDLLEKLSDKAQRMGDELYILMDIKDPKKNVNISYKQFLKYLTHLDQNFQEDDAKNIFKEFDRDQTNYISSLDFLNRLGMFRQNSEKNVVEGIQINKFKPHQKFFELVNQQLIQKQHTPLTYFKPSNEPFMKRSIFIFKLEDLGVKQDGNSYEIEQVTILLQESEYKDNVDLDKMCKALEHFQVSAGSVTNQDTEYACVVWFGNIDEAMAREGKSIRDLFELKSKQGTLSQISFDASLNELRLSKDYNYEFFYGTIKSKDSFDIEIPKLKEGLEREKISQDVIKKLKSATDQNSPEHLFNTWDGDHDKILNEKEFRAMVQVVNKELKPADIKYLFTRFDLRKKQGISLEEFKKILWSQNKDTQEKVIKVIRPFIEEVQRLLNIYNENFEDYFQSYVDKQRITQYNFIKALEQLRYDVKPNSIYHKYADETFKFIASGDLDIEYEELEKLYIKYKDLSKEKIKQVEVDEAQIIKMCKNISTYLVERDLNFNEIIRKYIDDENSITLINLRKCLLLDMSWPKDQMDQFLSFFSGNGIKDNNSVSLKLLKQYIHDDREHDAGRSRNDPEPVSTIKIPQKVLNTYFLFISEHPELKERLRVEDSRYEGFLPSLKVAQEFYNLDNEQKETVLDNRINVIQQDIEEIAKYFDCMIRNNIRYKSFLNKSEEYYIKLGRQKGGRDDKDPRRSIDMQQKGNLVGYDRDDTHNDRNNSSLRGTDNYHREEHKGITHPKQLSNLPGAFCTVKSKEIKQALLKQKVEILFVGKSFDKDRKGLCDPNLLFEELVRLKIPIHKEEKDALINSITMVNGQIDYQELSSVIDDLGGTDGKAKKEKVDDEENSLEDSEDKDQVAELSGGIKGKVSFQRIDKHFRKICKAIKEYCKNNKIEILTAFRQFDDNGQDFLTLNQFKKACKSFLKLDYTNPAKKQLFNSVFMKFDESSRDHQITKDEFRDKVIGDLSKVDISKILKSIRRQIAELENEDIIHKEFKKIDRSGEGKINFEEFQQYIEKVVRDIHYNEILAVFSRISKGSSEIEFNNFLSVIQEDHLNMKKIKDNFNNYCSKHSTTLENVFKHFSKDPQNQNFLNKESLENLCNYVNMKFDNHQIEDLFDYLDVSKNCQISLSEFLDAIQQQKFYVDYDKIYRMMRRHIITKKINFVSDMSTIDSRNTGFIDQPRFENYCEKREFPTNKVELEAVFSQMSLDTGRINYQTLFGKIANSPFDLGDIIDKIHEFMKKFNLDPTKMFTIFDFTKDQILDIQEFDNMCNQIGIQLAEAEVREAYHQFDIQNNGYIQLMDFTQVVTTFKNKKSEFNRPMNMDLLMTKNYDISKQNQLQIYYQNSIENLFQQNQSQVPQNYLEMSNFHEFNGMNQSVNTSDLVGRPSITSSQSLDPLNKFKGMNPISQRNLISPRNYGQAPQQYNKSQYLQIIKQNCEGQQKNPFIVFSQYTSKQFFTRLNETELEVSLKDIGVDNINPAHLTQFYADYKSYRDNKFNFVNMVKEIMEIGDFFKQFVLKSMEFNQLSLVKWFNTQRDNVKNQTNYWSIKEIQYIADYYDFILSEQEADQILKQMMTKGVSYGNKKVDLKRFTEWLGVEESYDPTQVTKPNQSYFNVNGYLDQIKSVCLKYDIKPIELFTYYDSDFDYTLKETQLDLLREILECVGVFLEKHQLLLFYKEFQNDQGEMKMMRILRQIMTPGQIFSSVLINMLRVNSWTLKEMFELLLDTSQKGQPGPKQSQRNSVVQLQQTQQVWRISEFNKINQKLSLEFTVNEINEAFESLSYGSKDQIIQLRGLEEILMITALKPPEIIKKQMDQSLQEKVNLLQKEVRDKKNPNKQQQKNMNSGIGGGFPGGRLAGGAILGEGGFTGYNDAINFGGLDQSNLATSQFMDSGKKFNMPPNQSQNQVGYAKLLPPQPVQPQLQPKGELAAKRSNVPHKPINKTVDYNKKDLTPNDYEKAELFMDKLSKYMQTECFEGFEMSSNPNNEGWFNEAALTDILENKYGITLNSDIRLCVYVITNGDKRGAHLDDLRTRLKISSHTASRKDNELQIRQDLGISKGGKAKKVYNINMQLSMQLKDLLKEIIKGPMLMIDTYFDPYQKPPKPTLSCENFREITGKIIKNSNIQTKQPMEVKDYDNLFFYLDTNGGGSVSLSEFKLKMFGEEEMQIIKDHTNQRFTSKMNQEIEELFNQCDTDKSGFLEASEIKEVLSQIGVNLGATELSAYIQRFDKDGDNRISKEEFMTIMEEKLKNEMLGASDMQEQLRIQFNKQDLQNRGELNRDQLMQVFVALGATVNQLEFDAIFSEVDLDLSGTVDIDEMMAYILKNQDNMSGLAQAAVLNIRSARKLGIQDLKSAFQGMPSNFRSSFMRSILQKGTNLPGSIIKPRLDAYNKYVDLKVEDPKDPELQKSFLNKNYYKSLKNVKYIEFRVEKATGIPIPDNNQIPRVNLKYREVIACLFDTNTNDFVGNSVRITADWKQEEEDVWEFSPGKKSLNVLILKLGDFDEKKISSLSLCFELNLHYLSKNQSASSLAMQQDLEMTCSYGMISINEMLAGGTKSINLEGGEPGKALEIKKDDVRTTRVGFFGGLSKAFTKITTSLKIQINKIESQSPDLFCLPKTILVHKFAAPLYQDYLEYFAMRSYVSPSEVNIQLAADNVIKNFIKIINCPDTFEKFTIFWLEEITPNVKGLKEMYQAFKKCCLHFYLVFSSSTFRFNNSDPTYSCHTFKTKAQRDKMIQEALDDLRAMLLQKGKIGNLRIDPNPLPFKLVEITEDDEDDILMYSKFFEAKAGFELKTHQLEN